MLSNAFRRRLKTHIISGCLFTATLRIVGSMENAFRDLMAQTLKLQAAAFFQQALELLLLTCQQGNGVQWTQISINIPASQYSTVQHSLPPALSCGGQACNYR